MPYADTSVDKDRFAWRPATGFDHRPHFYLVFGRYFDRSANSLRGGGRHWSRTCRLRLELGNHGGVCGNGAGTAYRGDVARARHPSCFSPARSAWPLRAAWRRDVLAVAAQAARSRSCSFERTRPDHRNDPFFLDDLDNRDVDLQYLIRLPRRRSPGRELRLMATAKRARACSPSGRPARRIGSSVASCSISCD